MESNHELPDFKWLSIVLHHTIDPAVLIYQTCQYCMALYQHHHCVKFLCMSYT